MRGRLARARDLAPSHHRRPPAGDVARRERLPPLSPSVAGSGSSECRCKVAQAACRASSPCRSPPRSTSPRRWAWTSARMHVVPVGVDHTVFRPRPGCRPCAGSHHGDVIERCSHEGLGAPARSGGQAAHRARGRARRHRSARAPMVGSPGPSSGSGLHPVVRCVSGISDDELATLYAEAHVAVVPSLYEGFSSSRHRGNGVRRAARGHHRRGVARSGGRRRRHRVARAARRPRGPCRGIRRVFDDDALAGRLGAGGPQPRARSLHLAGHRRGHGRELPGAARGAAPEATAEAPC